MKLQNTLDLSTFEIVRFRIWNQTSIPDDFGIGTKYFNTNSGHEGYNREIIYTAAGWRMSAYMDDIDRINEKLDLIFGEEIDTDTIIDSWKEVQDFLAGIEDTENLMNLLNSKLDKTGGTISGNITVTGNSSFNKRLSMREDAIIDFYNADGNLIGIFGPYSGKNYKLSWYDGSSWQILLHSGNVGGYAALKDGSNASGTWKININGSAAKLDDIAPSRFMITAIKDTGETDFNQNLLPTNRPAIIRLGPVSMHPNIPNPNLGYGYVLHVGHADKDTAWELVAGYASNTPLMFRTGTWNADGTGTINSNGWKTIAFTDSNVASAQALTHSNGTVAATAGRLGELCLGSRGIWSDDGTNNLFEYSNNTLWIGYSLRNNGETRLYGSPVGIYTGNSCRLLINSSGNVTIGDSDLAEDTYGLYVGKSLPSYFANRVLISGATDDGASLLQIGSESGSPLRITSSGTIIYDINLTSGWTRGIAFRNKDKNLLASIYAYGDGQSLGYIYIGTDAFSPSKRWLTINSAESSFSVLTKFNAGALIPTGQTLTIGSVTFRETAAGEVEVDGNLHTTGTLASGGKAQEGTGSTGGNAQVYQYDLASGESVYTVDNVKGSTNVIVQIYEWNSNTSSWDMILTDVNVKASGITVTFGRTTTVNHLVTVC